MIDPEDGCVVCGAPLGLRHQYCEACTEDRQTDGDDDGDDEWEEPENDSYRSDRYYGDYEDAYEDDV